MDIQSVKNRFGIIGRNEALNRAIEVALRVAPTDLSVVITGPSGAGKEFFPQIIHAGSSRKHSNYIAVNCGAIPEGTIDSELFGHEKGSFTGATDSRKGYFEEANGGTIFLDEVAELPLSTQVRLLRVLQTGEYMRVGSSRIHQTDVRVVAATNRDLQVAINEGKFREDLYYRLNTVPIRVPSLAERREDIYILFRKFASDIAVQYRMPAITLDNDARAVLEEYSWPGNVRQLKNVAEQVSAVEEKRTIDADTLRKYLPTTVTSPITVDNPSRSNYQFTDDRDLLYKFLFDLKADMNEVKRMLSEMQGDVRSDRAEIAGLLPGYNQDIPRISTPTVIQADPDAEYAESEELTPEEPREVTKEEVQREAIIKALRRHNGKRKEAARDLFISERTLYRRIKELGINEYK